MKSIKESAEEYAAISRFPSARSIRRDSYLAGAKYALEIAEARFKSHSALRSFRKEEVIDTLNSLIPE